MPRCPLPLTRTDHKAVLGFPLRPQVTQVRSEVDRLGREKVDLTALEHYTGKVSVLFEQVRGG